MPGLPIVDELYFERPSVRLGGWLAWHLKKAGVPYVNLTPGEGVEGTPVHGGGSLEEVLSRLEAQHKARPAGTYYYRGQVGRRQLQYFSEIRSLGKVTFKVESFLPSAYRKYAEDRADSSTPRCRSPPAPAESAREAEAGAGAWWIPTKEAWPSPAVRHRSRKQGGRVKPLPGWGGSRRAPRWAFCMDHGGRRNQGVA